ncbi:conjugal transfer protein TraD [Bartonella sp. AP9QHHD]|uniref:conjugal transfer protein TraD n=1 Tax=Bartonella sp. AP9QHHD TaxID=3243507 RepID=UPI0035CF8B9E
MSDEIRRKDAREKIILGGLVIKAGLKNADKSFILGCLIHAAKLDTNSNEYKNLQKIGQHAFADTRGQNDKQPRS